MKGVVLAGGTGSRLYPLTKVINKHLLPVYDKPMIYYPLNTLRQLGIDDILIVSNACDIPQFRELLGDDSITYAEQPQADGVVAALLTAEDFIQGEPVTLILGDNIFYGDHTSLKQKRSRGVHIFGCPVHDPERFGVLSFEGGEIDAIIEKPTQPPSNYAVPGLYMYDDQVIDFACSLEPSAGITDVNNIYLKRGELTATLLDPEFHWVDAGTIEALYAAATKVASCDVSAS